MESLDIKSEVIHTLPDIRSNLELIMYRLLINLMLFRGLIYFEFKMTLLAVYYGMICGLYKAAADFYRQYHMYEIKLYLNLDL